jgi:rubrerythrin
MNVFEKSKSCARKLKKLYADYSKSVVDEGLRKFLTSMSEQENSHLQFLEEKQEELANRKDLMEEAEALDGSIEACSEPKEVKELERVDFFSYAMEIEEQTMNMYKSIYESCNKNGELFSIFHSLFEEEKRHLSLVKDRYELESLMS